MPPLEQQQSLAPSLSPPVEAAAEVAANPPVITTPLAALAAVPGAMSLEGALTKLRTTAVRRAVNSQVGMCLAALGMAAIGGLLVFAAISVFPGDQEWLEFACFFLLGMALLSYVLIVLVTNRLLFGYHYWFERRRLLMTSEFLLFTDEELQRALHTWLPGQFWGAVSPKAQFSSLTQRLEHCAFHLDSLRSLARNPEAKPAGIWLSERVRQYSWIYDNAFYPLAGCLAVILPLVGELATLALPLHFVTGPRVIRAYAYLAAFIDAYLEKSQAVVAKFQPPEEPRGWWARTTAPWHSNR